MIIEYEQIEISHFKANDLSTFFAIIEIELKKDASNENIWLYRGEYKNFGNTALQPSIYRKIKTLKNEHILVREIKRFNDYDFSTDTSTLDNLCRMQHYSLPTRLIDLTEDPLSALWFAVSEAESKKHKGSRCVYMIKIKSNDIKYYDSDTVTAIANLSKLPLSDEYKSKTHILNAVKKAYKEINEYEDMVNAFNTSEGVSYLHHEIKKDISHYEPIINPEDITSVQCLKSKLSNSRIHNQKGAFLLFGLNYSSVKKAIPIIELSNNKTYLMKSKKKINHNPIDKIIRIDISDDINIPLLDSIGVKKAYIFSEMEKVAEYMKSTIV